MNALLSNNRDSQVYITLQQVKYLFPHSFKSPVLAKRLHFHYTAVEPQVSYVNSFICNYYVISIDIKFSIDFTFLLVKIIVFCS